MYGAFVAEADPALDGQAGHPGVFLGIGNMGEEPTVGVGSCGVCLATHILEQVCESPEQAARAVERMWGDVEAK